jgi:acyl-CoA synthetase (AMP-forming)/AMP-acid ligase II
MVRGPNVCVGLFDDPEREQSIFTDDGWLHTGDAGVLDSEGYLSIVGRKKEIIIRGGLNIAPREIEDLLCEMPEVRAAAVIGLPDERLGEIACACLVVDDAAAARVPDLDTVVDFLRSRDLANYKLPQLLRIVPELPTTPSGKIRKNELRESILGGTR